MEQERLEQIAQETGMSVDEVRDIQLEETVFGRIKRELRDLALYASPAILTGILATGSTLTTRDVYPLSWYDFNKDGTSDALIAYPSILTDNAKLAYVDGKHLEKKGITERSCGYRNGFQFSPKEIEGLSVFSINPLDSESISPDFNNRFAVGTLFLDRNIYSERYLEEGKLKLYNSISFAGPEPIVTINLDGLDN